MGNRYSFVSLHQWCKDNNKVILLKELNDNINPKDFSYASQKKVLWKCQKCSNTYEASIHNRTNRNSGCPYCANLKIKEGFNDLATKNPQLAKEWNYEKNGNLTPNQIVEFSTKKVWWKCNKCGGEWEATPNQRHKRNCPYCGHHLLKKEDSIEILFPNLMKEWDYVNNTIRPSDCSKSSDKLVWWKCEKGHRWKTAVKVRTRGNGCPYCANQKVLVGYNDLFTINPNLEKEWDYEANIEINPKNITSGSNKKANWICSKCGTKWKSIITARAKGRGCPKCGLEKSTTNRLKNRAIKNSFIKNYPNLVEEWDFEKNNIDINLISSSSNKRVWWKCNKGHSWKAAVCQRTSKNTKCPYCDGQKVIVGENDLVTLNKELSEEWDYKKNYPLKPTEVCYHSGKIVWWKCDKCGKSWKAKINNRANGRGCPNCSPTGTSFMEQAIYYYIKKIYIDAENRYKFKDFELDIYIPSIKTAIEYDGYYYHSIKNSEQREQKKNLFCKKEGINLIRLREKPLKESKNSQNIICDCTNWNNIEKTINDLLGLLMVDKKPNISIKKDLNNIVGYKKELINKRSFGISYPNVLKEWDYEKNYPLLPNYFSKGSSVKVWWKCKNGHSWETKINNRCKDNGTNCPICNPKKHIKKVLCVETNEIFDNAKIAAKKVNGKMRSIQSVCRGQTKEHKGFHWKYVK